MLSIIGMFIAAWFLNLFGFGKLVIEGLQQFGGPKITMTGYYFIFACAGLLKSILSSLSSVNIKSEIKDLEEKLSK